MSLVSVLAAASASVSASLVHNVSLVLQRAQEGEELFLESMKLHHKEETTEDKI
jgi:hypothetical protein